MIIASKLSHSIVFFLILSLLHSTAYSQNSDTSHDLENVVDSPLETAGDTDAEPAQAAADYTDEAVDSGDTSFIPYTCRCPGKSGSATCASKGYCCCDLGGPRCAGLMQCGSE